MPDPDISYDLEFDTSRARRELRSMTEVKRRAALHDLQEGKAVFIGEMTAGAGRVTVKLRLSGGYL